MYKIARLLFYNKRLSFTINDLKLEFHRFPDQLLYEALKLTKYKIFPVRHSRQGEKEYFYFDRKYLR